jgi:hypothetical protein
MTVRGTRLAVLAAALILLASCTFLRLSYEHADTLILATLDRYLDLTSAQEQDVRERTRELLGWHRATELPDYVKLVESARRKVAGSITPEEVLEFNAAVNQRLLRAGDRAAPALARLALTLTPDQIDRLDRKLSDDTARIARELAAGDPALSVRRRTQRFVDRAEGWFGDLRPDQKAMVREVMHAQPEAAVWIVDERSRRRADLVALLRRIAAERPDAQVAADWMRAYFARLDQPEDPAERLHLARLQRERAELIAQLLNAADSAQRASVAGRLADYAGDFSVLAAERNAN